MNYQQEQNFFNALNIFSVALGYENLQENRAQSRYNDVHAANDRQAEYLLGQLDKRFTELASAISEQNVILKEILECVKNGQAAR